MEPPKESLQVGGDLPSLRRWLLSEEADQVPGADGFKWAEQDTIDTILIIVYFYIQLFEMIC